MPPVTGKRSKLKTAALKSLREFDFTEADFAQAQDLLHKLTGMTMGARKGDLVYSRLVRRIRSTGAGSFPGYLQLVRSDGAESEHFVNALTTNLTSFFREPHHFPILGGHALRSKPQGGYRVWCAAASTGEEPYTIAIALANAYGTSSPPVRITATDLDTNVLATARNGIYDEARITSLDRSLLATHFLRGKNGKSGQVRVSAALRERIEFKQLNLLGATWPLAGPFDAIFLRNVLIYFDRPAQLKTLRRLAGHLAPGGLLFTGHSESLFYASDIFRPVGPTVYEHAAARAQRP